MKLSERLNKIITFGEDIIYSVIVLFLFTGAVFLIINEISTFKELTHKSFNIQLIIELIAKTLLLLMIIEILVTVKISIAKHTIQAEPFLIVGLIASIRRILIISIETAYKPEYFEHYMIEIGVIAVLIFVFIISIVLLRKHKPI